MFSLLIYFRRFSDSSVHIKFINEQCVARITTRYRVNNLFLKNINILVAIFLLYGIVKQFYKTKWPKNM